MRKDKLTITIDKEIVEKAKKHAKEMGISLSALIAILLNKAVKENEV